MQTLIKRLAKSQFYGWYGNQIVFGFGRAGVRPKKRFDEILIEVWKQIHKFFTY